jgi:hypothetical protein
VRDLKKSRLIASMVSACLLAGTFVAHTLAAARDSIRITSQGPCPNASLLWTVVNVDPTNGIVVTIRQTMNSSGQSYQSSFDISLDAAAQKTLGCEVNDVPPAGTGRFTWEVQDARYR